MYYLKYVSLIYWVMILNVTTQILIAIYDNLNYMTHSCSIEKGCYGVIFWNQRSKNNTTNNLLETCL